MTRREFVKKAVYSAPVLIPLGGLAKSFERPHFDPNARNGGGYNQSQSNWMVPSGPTPFPPHCYEPPCSNTNNPPQCSDCS